MKKLFFIGLLFASLAHADVGDVNDLYGQLNYYKFRGDSAGLTNLVYGPVPIASTGITIVTNTVAATGQKTYTFTSSGGLPADTSTSSLLTNSASNVKGWLPLASLVAGASTNQFFTTNVASSTGAQTNSYGDSWERRSGGVYNAIVVGTNAARHTVITDDVSEFANGTWVDTSSSGFFFGKVAPSGIGGVAGDLSFGRGFGTTLDTTSDVTVGGNVPVTGKVIGNGGSLTNIPITGLWGSGGTNTAATNGTAGQTLLSSANGGVYWGTASSSSGGLTNNQVNNTANGIIFTNSIDGLSYFQFKTNGDFVVTNGVVKVPYQASTPTRVFMANGGGANGFNLMARDGSGNGNIYVERGDFSFLFLAENSTFKVNSQMYAPDGYRTDMTITTPGTTGNQVINKSAGTVNIAASGTSVTVTCNKVTTSSLVFCTLRTVDTTAKSAVAVPGTGSVVITLNAAAAAEVAIQFWVLNP